VYREVSKNFCVAVGHVKVGWNDSRTATIQAPQLINLQTLAKQLGEVGEILTDYFWGKDSKTAHLKDVYCTDDSCGPDGGEEGR